MNLKPSQLDRGVGAHRQAQIVGVVVGERQQAQRVLARGVDALRPHARL